MDDWLSRLFVWYKARPKAMIEEERWLVIRIDDHTHFADARTLKIGRGVRYKLFANAHTSPAYKLRGQVGREYTNCYNLSERILCKVVLSTT
jgi:hypothetical protein